eukprot:8255044-Pyramimonas_sp.AAC.1
MFLGNPPSPKRLSAENTLVRNCGRVQHRSTRAASPERKPLMRQESPSGLENSIALSSVGTTKIACPRSRRRRWDDFGRHGDGLS